MVLIIGWGLKKVRRDQVHEGFLWLEENMKNGREEKGSGGRDGLL